MATIKFYEYLALAIVWPLASIIYLLLQFNWPTIPAILLPLILILFLVLVFLAITPCQYWTALGITAELTGTTVVGLLQDVPDLRTPIVVVLVTLGVFVFWWLSIYIVLSARGVKREEMGRLGEMTDGVDVVAHGVDVGICMIAKGVRIVCCGNAGRDQIQVRPSPYQFFPFSDVSVSSFPSKLLWNSNPQKLSLV